MANFDSGVKGYRKGIAHIMVAFPVDWNDRADISCKQCEFYQPTARKCGLNHHIVAYPDKYVGDFCPLEIEEESNEASG